MFFKCIQFIWPKILIKPKEVLIKVNGICFEFVPLRRFYFIEKLYGLRF